MSSEQNQDLSPLLIDQKKLLCFQNWCQNQQLDSQAIIEQFIDVCLHNDKSVIKTFLESQNNENVPQEIKSYIEQFLSPLILRIEQLEAQIKCDQNSSFSQTLQQSPKDKKIEHPVLEQSHSSQDDEHQSRIYLTRQEVWRRLKQTDYVKYSGYDSFLKAKGDDFVPYGIFFDSQKKRFYILDK